MSKYGVFSGPYFPVFGPEKTLYLDDFHAVYKTEYSESCETSIMDRFAEILFPWILNKLEHNSLVTYWYTVLFYQVWVQSSCYEVSKQMRVSTPSTQDVN